MDHNKYASLLVKKISSKETNPSKNTGTLKRMMYLDMSIREVIIPYVIKLEAKLRDGHEEKQSFKKVINEITMKYGTHKNELEKILLVNIKENGGYLKKKCYFNDIPRVLLIIKQSRNLLMHGKLNLFSEEFNEREETKSQKVTGKESIEPVFKTTKNNHLFSNKKLVFPILLKVLVYANQYYVARRIIAQVDELLMKFYINHSDKWETKEKFYNNLGLKSNWVDFLG